MYDLWLQIGNLWCYHACVFGVRICGIQIDGHKFCLWLLLCGPHFSFKSFRVALLVNAHNYIGFWLTWPILSTRTLKSSSLKCNHLLNDDRKKKTTDLYACMRDSCSRYVWRCFFEVFVITERNSTVVAEVPFKRWPVTFKRMFKEIYLVFVRITKWIINLSEKRIFSLSKFTSPTHIYAH